MATEDDYFTLHACMNERLGSFYTERKLLSKRFEFSTPKEYRSRVSYIKEKGATLVRASIEINTEKVSMLLTAGANVNYEAEVVCVQYESIAGSNGI